MYHVMLLPKHNVPLICVYQKLFQLFESRCIVNITHDVSTNIMVWSNYIFQWKLYIAATHALLQPAVHVILMDIDCICMNHDFGLSPDEGSFKSLQSIRSYFTSSSSRHNPFSNYRCSGRVYQMCSPLYNACLLLRIIAVALNIGDIHGCFFPKLL